MLSEKHKAAVSAGTEATAQNYNRLNKSYPYSTSSSRAKLQIGELLLTLQAPLSQEQQEKYWQLFESILRQYLDLRICEVAL